MRNSFSRQGLPALRPFCLAAAIVSACVLSLPAEAQNRGGNSVPTVQTDPVRVEPLSQTLPVLGRLVAREAGVVAARERGAIDSVHVDVGDRVKRGDVLAVLVSDRLKAELDLRTAEVNTETANVDMRHAELDQKRQEFDRIKQLEGSGAFPRARFDDVQKEVVRAEAMLASSLAELSQAQAMHRQAEIAYGYATIRAPYPGVVSERHVSRGVFVDPGDPVISLVNDEDLEIEADVPFERIRGLEPGTVVRVGLNGVADRNAVVRAVVPNENPLTRTRVVRFTPDFSGPAHSLAVNQSINVLIPLGEGRKVLSMHKDALLKDSVGTYVFVVAEGKAQRRNVGIGEGFGGRFEVRDGLQAGDMVVIRGNERLLPDQEVKVDGGGRAPRGQGREGQS